MAEKIKLTGVPETMLQTIYARANESKNRKAIFDEKAIEIIDNLDYNFSLASKDKPMHDGVVARTIVLDKLTKNWLLKNNNGIVVNIACGLDTRCYRMSNYCHWYNLDLPETISVREKLLPENGIISQISSSAMDDWSNEIKEKDVPTLVIIEGLSMYLTANDVKKIFSIISNTFLHVTVFIEIMNPLVVKHFKEKSIDASNAKFKFGIKNGKKLASLIDDFSFDSEYSLTLGMKEFFSIYKIFNKIPFIRNFSNKIVVLKK